MRARYERLRGFTFIELMAVLAVLATISFSAIPTQQLETNERLIDRVVGRVLALQEAIFAKCTGDANCFDVASEYTITKLEQGGYLPTFGFANPYGSGVDDFTVTVPVDGDTLDIEFGAPTASDARLVASRLPTARYMLDGTDHLVKLTLIKPGQGSAYSRFLPLDGSQAMIGNLNMDRNALLEVDSIAGDDGTVTCKLFPTVENCDNPIEIWGPLRGATFKGVSPSCTDIEGYDGCRYEIEVLGDLEVAGEVRTLDDLIVEGDIHATAFFYDSDARQKTDIQDIEAGHLDKLLQLRTVRFRGIDDTADTPPRFGVIAQDVEQYFPGLVVDKSDGYKGVNYQSLVPLLVAQSRQLMAQVAQLEAALKQAQAATAAP